MQKKLLFEFVNKMGSEQNRCKNNQAVNNTPVITFVLPKFFFQISFKRKAMVFNKTKI